LVEPICHLNDPSFVGISLFVNIKIDYGSSFAYLKGFDFGGLICFEN